MFTINIKYLVITSGDTDYALKDCQQRYFSWNNKWKQRNKLYGNIPSHDIIEEIFLYLNDENNI